MKYIKYFKEAIIMPDITEDDNTKISTFEDAVEYGKKNGYDVVMYDDFINSLSERNKETAPPKGQVPFFALFNPNTNRPMFVFNFVNMISHMPMKEIMDDIIGHEKIHQQQNSRRKVEFQLPDPTKMKKYFSNKDEIMAFSYSVSKELMKFSRNPKDAISNLGKSRLWNDINRFIDDNKILNRYKKYIYLYLVELFKK